MTGSTPRSFHQRRLKAAIFDVDGVLLASPHEQAWREALDGFADPSRFTPQLYETEVAGKPRMAGAIAALGALGVPQPERQAASYAARKQKRLEELIHDAHVSGLSRCASVRSGCRGFGVADGGRVVLQKCE